ncbi:MAG: ribonuclease HI [Candidatus Pacebacteria bacterium]|nr:ribonuclease HI [Candidatus Paceibacterota bacterium]MBP9700944.1 ribonuclease HI [Candidatus Paceibacterota bacterium]
MKNEITLYTDGASRGNPGPGGWGAIIIGPKNAVELAGAKKPATNNQMELEAVIQGLRYIQEQSGDATVALHADSRYVLNGIEKWLDGWVRKGWVTMAKKPVENKGQWEELLALRDHFGKKLKLVKVDGHSGHLYNDRCDELAVMAALNKNPHLFEGAIVEYDRYLKENPPISEKKSPSKAKTGPAYSYVSLVGGSVYADKDWATCEKRVKGKTAKYKKVFSKAEETDLIQDYTLQSLL